MKPLSDEQRGRIVSTDVLLIDEISMLSRKMFEKVSIL